MGAEPGVTVAVVGAVGAGIVYHLPRMPESGETLLTGTIQVVPGGKASNHAIGLRRLGAGVRLFSAAGRDPFAEQARAAWRAEELDARGVVELDGVPSLIGSVLVDAAGDNRIVIGTGAMGRYRAEHVQAFAAEIAACDLLLVSLEMPAAPGLRALRIARDAGVTTVLNPAPAPSPADVARLLPLCDWVTPNRAEAVAMTGLSDPRAAATRLRELGAGGAVVTLGGDGALLLGGGEELAVPAMRVEVLDTSGAGDAFNCAFALAIAQGLPAVEAVRRGCLAAGLIVQGPNFTDALRLWDRLPGLLGGPQAPPPAGGPQAPLPGGPEVPAPVGPTTSPRRERIGAMTTGARRGRPTEVYLELGSRRVFACALDWPGWCRSGKTEELALEALAAYADRYAVVARQAGVAFPAGTGDDLKVVERLQGSGKTDFGLPGEVAAADARRATAAQAQRLAALVVASWAVFDQVRAGTPEELRKGPRGGGRDRDKMVDHVLGAEAAYARMLGIRRRQPAIDDRAAIEALRGDLAAVLRAPSDGTPPVPKGWPPRYAARRIAWHVLDHAWEMQDRSDRSG